MKINDMINTLVPRPEYMQHLEALRGKSDIVKILSGVRRCGKSTLLEMFRDKLILSGISPERTLTINLEDFASYALRDSRNLHAYIESRLVDDELTYIFIDEVQHCPDFPAVVESIRMRKSADIYLTRSNAILLSSEIATLLTGRYVGISMLPLSLREYAFGATADMSPERLFAHYLSSSSFPYARALQDDTENAPFHPRGKPRGNLAQFLYRS